ncbi:hypothetical protein [Proteus columbae]|uniref:hypothetical protein n=1 Tax=Proteus columbae TaxID=1987580 RepID=UPI00288B97B9|nr:hypothetical protein [Proteus columbae]
MKMRNLMMASLTSVLMTSSFNVLAGTDMGAMTLNLTGVIDMNINPSQVQYINGTLSGTTSFQGKPIYDNQSNPSWNSVYAIISLSQSQSRCNSTFVSKIPNQSNKYGLKLTHSSNSGTVVYVTPQFNYNVSLSNFGSSFQSVYTGQFFQPNSGVVDKETPDVNVCYVPSNYATTTVPAGGTKNIRVTVPSSFPVYIDAQLTPGKLTYTGTPFYVGSFGRIVEGDFYAKVNVNANVTVKRSCAVTGVSNQQINENMTFTNEVIKDSVFTLSCGGTGNPVNMSAVIKEGSLDPNNVNKLVLAPINGTVSDKKPWVIGLPYKQTSTPSLKCANESNNDLLKFNNTDLELTGTNMGNNQPDIFGIKWAICKPDGTKAGEYRGKVDVNIFVRG